MRYDIVDSHRNWRGEKIRALKDFLAEVKSLDDESAYEQVDFINRYEKEYAVKCFEAIAWDKGRVVGYMRCFRDPENPVGWFVGDIHVLLKYRNKGIAGRLYDRAIDEVMEYEAAEYIEASVSVNNAPSRGLHFKMGFSDTCERKKFANFYFGEDETFFRLMLFRYYPLLSMEYAAESLGDLWNKCLLESSEIKNSQYGTMTVEQLGDEALKKRNVAIETIWNGNKLVGISLENEKERLEYQLYC